jgi:DNA-binding NarL/FixJ family response regulator/Skp family chaperone for outer membrane proteins
MRLLIVDDHEVVRRGIRSILSEQADWEVCGEAVDGLDVLEQARELRPDVIVMDVSMPRLNGLEATRQLRDMLPDCEVLILSQHENAEMARQALKAGARGYVAKNSISKHLLSAITRVSRRDYFFDPAILGQTSSAHTDIQEILQRAAGFEKALRESEERFRSLADTLGKLNDSSSRLWQMQSLKDGIEEMLSATIKLVGADKGNVQILDRERGVLIIEAQRGFKKEFLDFFREVSTSDDTACGRALRECERTVIEDVEQDTQYAPYRNVARAAGYRAVIFSPLVKKNGTPLGILSTHFRLPHRPSDEDLRRLDLYVRQASDFIERCKMDEELRRTAQRFRMLSANLDSEVRARTSELEKKNVNLLAQSEELRELSQRLLRLEDEQKRHIARELHDSAGQTLAVLSMNVPQFVRLAERSSPELAKRAAEIEELVQQVIRQVRTTSYLLHPPAMLYEGMRQKESATKEPYQTLVYSSRVLRSIRGMM